MHRAVGATVDARAGMPYSNWPTTKQFRRIATRYEKTARAFVSMLCIAAARLWIKTVNSA